MRALVVGGSGGIGAAVSVMLASEGVSLLIHGGHNQARLDATLARCREVGCNANGVLLPIAQAEDAESLVKTVREVDILVVAYGPWLELPVDQTPVEEWRFLTEANLILPAYLLGRFLPGMRSRRYGRVVLFGGPRSDRAGGFQRIGAYAAVKAGLASLVRSVATQYAQDNVRCNMIAPGYVETEYLTDEQVERIRVARPTRRLVQPRQIAALCRALLDDSLDPVNGAIIPVDYGE